jgi:transcription antitermination factor NusG
MFAGACIGGFKNKNRYFGVMAFLLDFFEIADILNELVVVPKPAYLANWMEALAFILPD